MKLILKEKYLSKNKEVVYLIFECSKKLNFQAGQFVIFDKLNLKRAYSIASSPFDNKLGFYIKKASENGMSNYLVKKIKIQDEIACNGPFGHMILNTKFDNFLLVSIGSGLGPILSIYRTLIKTGNYKKIVNIYGERYEENIVDIILKEIKSYENDSIKNMFFLSKEEINGFYKGYVQDGFEKAIEFLGKDNLGIYMCGKPAMVEQSINKLISLGIKKENIFYEKF